ncbi:MAG: hypothetical protein E6K41_07215, partial [Gammaproteobacteria bacterium]
MRLLFQGSPTCTATPSSGGWRASPKGAHRGRTASGAGASSCTGGAPHADPGELAARIASAAARTGIGLTLLPVFYAHSGFGGAAPAARQRRFVSEPDGFARIVEACRRVVRPLAGASVGVAPHSLRAVTPEELSRVVSLAPGGPVHIHIAEQIREVEECVAWSGRRPIEWLLENQPLGP